MVYNSKPLRTKEQINDVLFYLRRTKHPERDTFLFLIGINTGLRCSDIVKLKIGTLRQLPQPVIVEQKTGKKRILYLNEMVPVVEKYIEGKEDDEWAFPSMYDKNTHITRDNVYRLFHRIDKQLGHIGFTTHTMRRTFGYWYYKRTKNIYFLMQLFNHSNEEITKRYIGLTDEELGQSLEGFKLGFQ